MATARWCRTDPHDRSVSGLWPLRPVSIASSFRRFRCALPLSLFFFFYSIRLGSVLPLRHQVQGRVVRRVDRPPRVLAGVEDRNQEGRHRPRCRLRSRRTPPQHRPLHRRQGHRTQQQRVSAQTYMHAFGAVPCRRARLCEPAPASASTEAAHPPSFNINSMKSGRVDGFIIASIPQ